MVVGFSQLGIELLQHFDRPTRHSGELVKGVMPHHYIFVAHWNVFLGIACKASIGNELPLLQQLSGPAC